MASNAKRAWIGGTAFAAAVLAAGSWFFAVSPNLTAASERRAEAEDTRAFNDVLNLKLAKLKSDFGKLDTYKADLAAAETQIPPQAQLETYLDGLDAIAVARGVTITAATAGTPEEFVLAEVEEPTPTPSESADSEDAATDEETSDSNAADKEEKKGPKIPDGLTAIPVSVTVLGTYDSTMAFLDDVYRTTPRVFLVSALTGTSQKESEGTAGKPATASGDQELVITGYIYVLPNKLTPETSEPPAGPIELPSKPGKNPLLPVQGD